MLALLLILAAHGAPDFAADQRQASQDLQAARQARYARILKGDLEAAEKDFQEALPEPKRTAAHFLIIGDALFALDPEFSLKQHQRAFELAPDEPQVAQAWAGELYRRGRCEEALPIYARLATTPWNGGIQRVDCLLRTGRSAEALEAWRSTRNMPGLSKYFRVLPERLGPDGTREQRRLRLRKALVGGASEGAEELAFLDLLRQSGPRRFEVERMDFESDRRLIGTQLDPTSRRARELWTVCDFWVALWERNFPPASAGDFATKFGERMRELGWLDSGGDVPAHALVLRWATSALLESGLRKPQDLLADWERALVARLEEGEADAGRALLQIQRAAGSAQLAETEALLWSRAHDLDAVLALLERRGEHLDSQDALLKGALERHPGSAALCALASACARREKKGEREALLRELSACFQPPGDAERAEQAFARLEELLASERR